ncbi:MAG: hypothetical protein AB7O49_16790 [Sphingomonadales bacterium]
MAATKKLATVKVLNSSGVGMAEANVDHQWVGFTFDKISGYRGESLKEMNVRVGAQVIVEIDDDGSVLKVEYAA